MTRNIHEMENQHEFVTSAAIVDEMELSSISSTIAAVSRVGLTIPDAVCTVLCA
jgi:hypothetical protein